MSQDADVVVVGAGPVGLAVALQIKLSVPSARIVVFEKYSTYLRHHTVYLSPKVFQKSPVREYVSFREVTESLTPIMRTSDVESKLLQAVITAGVEIRYEAVTDCTTLAKRFPSAKLFIGADGSHSTVHQKIFKSQYQLKRVMRYVVEVKYELESNQLAHITSADEDLPSATYHLVHETVAETTVALRFFISEQEYDQMKSATFKNPYTLMDEKKIDPLLWSSISGKLKKREEVFDEKINPNSVRITAVSLPTYASVLFAKKNEIDQSMWALVGDAAFGSPYFRSLNNGLISSCYLANMAIRLLQGADLIECVTEYNRRIQYLMSRELLAATQKNNIISAMQFANITGAKYDNQTLRHLQKAISPSSY